MSSYSRRRGTNSGIAQKAPVRCATTANITLANFQTIDGVTPTTNQHPRLLRVLVKNQNAPAQNGIYEMQTGTWQRTADFNSTEDFSKGTRVGVTDGATQVSEWVVTSTINPDSFQWDVDPITFADALTTDYSSVLSVLDIGVTVQAWDADLDQFAALTPADNSFLVGDGTDWTLESGATARATLGLTIGTDVQAWDAQLDLWAAETPSDYYDAAAVDTAINAAAAAILADLASNLNGEGAGLVGIYDAAGYYTGTTVEAALQEIGAAAYLSNVVEDATPQLGGDLDLNSNDITGTGNIDITGSVTVAGDLNIDDNTIIYDDDTQGTIFRLVDGTQWTWHDATGSVDRMILDRATGALDVASIETTGNAVIGGSVSITGNDPVITMTDTDTGAVNRISANNATGSLRLYADIAAAVANSRLYLNVDGVDQVELSSTVAAFAVDVTVPDEAYGVGWNASLEAPTKNAVYDKIETLQPLDSDLTSWAGVARASGYDTFAATPSSANLRSLLSDESGTGVAYFQGGDLGTPSAGVLTNCTGLPIVGHGQCVFSKVSTNVVLAPYNGNKLVINSVSQSIPDAGVSLSASGLSTSTLYFIYAYMNAGTMTLEASTTGHSAQAGTGVEIKTGDATRTLVGMAYVITGPAFADTAATRYVRSWFNRRVSKASANFSTGRTFTTTSFAEINSEIAIAALMWSGELWDLTASQSVSHSVLGEFCALGLALDGATTAPFHYNSQSHTNTYAIPWSLRGIATGLSEGRHTATLSGRTGSGTGTCAVGSIQIAELAGVVVQS